MGLAEYRKKRDFEKTPEPEGDLPPKRNKIPLRFVVQMHAATRLHYDLRIEMGGVFKSWAVPKGPSLNPLDQRLAVFVEDHPLSYGSFEGIIPPGNYGAGTVLIWDRGTVVERTSKDYEESETRLLEGLEKGKITFVLEGQRLNGEFALIKIDQAPKAWLLVKKRDKFAQFKEMEFEPISVATGRNLEEIHAQAPSKGEIWFSNKTTAPPKKKKSVLPTKAKGNPAAKEKMPRLLKPMLATQVESLPTEKGWVFEPCHSGYRALASVEGKSIKLYSKQGLSFEKKFPEIVDSLKTLRDKVLLDGEIIVLDESGKVSTELLKKFEKQRQGTPVYRVWDLLHLNGKELRSQSLKERKSCLKKVLKGADKVLDLVKESKKPEKIDAEIIFARYESSDYQSGTSNNWLKLVKREPRSVAPVFSNTDKVFFPKEGIRKGDVIEYYDKVSSFILPHLLDRPQSLHRHPNGIEAKGFFQKDITGHTPRFVQTTRVESRSSQKSIDYLLCQNKETLLYMANLGCIELNPWLSRYQKKNHPDYFVIDLDPDGNSFDEVIEVALCVKEVLDEKKITAYCKTSGATGLHICVPTQAVYEYEELRSFAETICISVYEKLPKLTSVERTPSKRRRKIYLDFLQNRRGQTLASVYGLRPRAGAPVSTPLEWGEVKRGLRPEDFSINSIFERLQEKGDLWAPLLTQAVRLPKA